MSCVKDNENNEDMNGNIYDLDKLLEEVQVWDVKNIEDTKNERRFSFSDISKDRAKTIDLIYNGNGQIDFEILQTEINMCKEEFIKVRVPSNVDIIMISTDTNTDSERIVKTIAEYFV